MHLEYYYNKSGISRIAESNWLVYSYWQFLEVVFCKKKKKNYCLCSKMSSAIKLRVFFWFKKIVFKMFLTFIVQFAHSFIDF